MRDYLVRNPEVLVEAFDALEKKRQGEQSATQKAAIAELGAELSSSPEGTVLGNPQGDVTVVEFFDYNCSFCKRAAADMESLLQNDGNVRFVLKEIPVLGAPSVGASRVSLALRKVAPDRYGDYHRKLLAARGVVDEDKAIETAESMGVSEASLREAMAAPDIAAELENTNRMAIMLGINGTPSYVIGDEVMAGAVGLDNLKQKIDNVRNCQSATC